jgi:VanZ family protein
MISPRQRFLAWLPALIVALGLFVASSIPGTSYPQVDVRYADKMVHLAFYAALGAACARALLRSTAFRGAALVLIATGIATAFGATDELHQLFVPFRSADWHDLVADAVGALIGSTAWGVVGPRLRALASAGGGRGRARGRGRGRGTPEGT